MPYVSTLSVFLPSFRSSSLDWAQAGTEASAQTSAAMTCAFMLPPFETRRAAAFCGAASRRTAFSLAPGELFAQPLPGSRRPFALVLGRDMTVVGIHACDAPCRRTALQREVQIPDRREVVLFSVHEVHRHPEVFEQAVVLQRPAQELA